MSPTEKLTDYVRVHHLEYESNVTYRGEKVAQFYWSDRRFAAQHYAEVLAKVTGAHLDGVQS
jgi:hypothetical protein